MPDCCWIFLVALVGSILCVKGGIVLGPRMGGLDLPTGHKQHERPVPYLGGIGVMAALMLFVVMDGFQLTTTESTTLISLTVSGSMIFFMGLADDRWNLCYRLRLLVQSVAALIMIFGAGVALVNLGELVPTIFLGLGVLSIPLTIFGVLSVSNALNMMDGIDGLSGLLSLISFLLLAIIAYSAGDQTNGLLALSLAGGVMGFLLYNMRCCGRHGAEVYLGDNGSMLIGFMLAWLFIDLSQGPDPAMTPVTALFLFSLPLYDSALTIARRVWLGKSPFRADRSHLHHLLLDAGASVETAAFILAGFHLLLGLVGLFGLYLGVAEWLLFQVFVLLSLVYAFVVLRPWRFVPWMRILMVRLGITLQHGTGIFIGGIHPDDVDSLVAELRPLLQPRAGIRAYAYSPRLLTHESVFIVVDIGSWYEVRRTLPRLRQYLSMEHPYEVRQYIARNPSNDRRSARRNPDYELRRTDRRGQLPLREILLAPEHGAAIQWRDYDYRRWSLKEQPGSELAS
ncbi:MraY family glycosyltransferase [Halochromatium salexigens]|uniref:Undecaprenyl/decaprenyl-phosphate alpha-N-acetylglucosaminyl 1-phosphate transferase n=1 Tax=Halochromatium salexigens TaxID=49447 RepID=A0AAJ0UEP3_HALSE|nr:MraY family glycosyltransferase [Halochromatium salexigens]MBK5930069.1 hypothetical protein [Halochromatium salexigens]